MVLSTASAASSSSSSASAQIRTYSSSSSHFLSSCCSSPGPVAGVRPRPRPQFQLIINWNYYLVDWRSSMSSRNILSGGSCIIDPRSRGSGHRSTSSRPRRKSTTRTQLYLVRSELGGNYEENYADVDKHLMDYFTYKAVRTVLVQLYEMNPTQYSWLYNFVVENKPQDSKAFLRLLVMERQELGERVMVTRLHLYNKWIKKHDHAKTYQAISDQNLELLRERLVQIVKWPSDTSDDLDQS